MIYGESILLYKKIRKGGELYKKKKKYTNNVYSNFISSFYNIIIYNL